MIRFKHLNRMCRFLVIGSLRNKAKGAKPGRSYQPASGHTPHLFGFYVQWRQPVKLVGLLRCGYLQIRWQDNLRCLSE